VGQKSIYLEKKCLDETFGNASKPSRPTLYFALFTASPSDSTDTGTEVSGGSYARAAVTNNSTNFPAAARGGSSPATKSNGIDIFFPTSTAGWGNIVAFGVYDAATSGNLLYWGAVSGAPFATVSGKRYKILNGNLSIQET